jgi:Tol biopolymer transport system component
MSLETGRRLGPYEIETSLGAGGQGEVYRARDTRLGRLVAIKVLPAEFSVSELRRRRFEEEARTVSRLNHPHIETLHDIGHDGDVDYIVLEYLEGETLSKRLERGPLPRKEALARASEIADALDSAHRAGVVHRDIKPGNIMLTASGAKLLDFGLAHVRREELLEASDSESPTQAKPLTEGGVVLGTLPYMAPEQLQGVDADARTDIFALGLVLFEMLAGRRAFEGRTRASLIAAILDNEPQALSDLPPLLVKTVSTCLEKNPEERFQSAADVRLALSWVEGFTETTEARTSGHGWALAALAAFLATSVLLLVFFLRREPIGEVRELALVPPAGASFVRGEFALSPNGQKLAFAATDEAGERRLWVRELESFSVRSLPATEGAAQPFWSPRGDEIAFFAQNQLKRVSVSGGAPRTICDAEAGRGGTWSKNDVVVFAPAFGPLHRVDASGGTPAPVSNLDIQAKESAHRWPEFLPDGEHFLFHVRSGVEGKTGAYLGSLDGSTVRFLFPSSSNALYVPPGYTLFHRDGGLLAQRFDASKLELFGDARSLPWYVELTRFSQVALSVSADGRMVFSGGGQRQQLVWYDRLGIRLGTLGAPGDHHSFRLSPDGSQLALARIEDRFNLWLLDVDGSVPLRLTSSGASDILPMWSSDGRHLLFNSQRTGSWALFRIDVFRGSEPELVFDPGTGTNIRDLAGEPAVVVYEREQGLYAHHLDGGSDDYSLVANATLDGWMSLLSPNGKWLAYSANETGRDEVFVTGFPRPGRRWPVSRNGGRLPRWRADGREIFFIDAKGSLVVVPVETGDTFRVGDPEPLFVPAGDLYDAAPDGERFLVNEPLPEPPELNVVLDWMDALPK